MLSTEIQNRGKGVEYYSRSWNALVCYVDKILIKLPKNLLIAMQSARTANESLELHFSLMNFALMHAKHHMHSWRDASVLLSNS